VTAIAISPVAKKLLVKPGHRVLVLRPEPLIDDAIAVLPEGASRVARAPADVVLLFARDSKVLAREAPKAFGALAPNASLWIAYPKISSKLETDLTRDRGWDAVTKEGWQVVSLVAIDATWSAMRYKKDEGGALRADREARVAARKNGDAPKARVSDEAPDDFAAALKKARPAAKTWSALAASHRREYVEWIVGAKKAETRAKRIASAIGKLEAGNKRPS
jgi:hypothetical protein